MIYTVFICFTLFFKASLIFTIARSAVQTVLAMKRKIIKAAVSIFLTPQILTRQVLSTSKTY